MKIVPSMPFIRHFDFYFRYSFVVVVFQDSFEQLFVILSGKDMKGEICRWPHTCIQHTITWILQLLFFKINPHRLNQHMIGAWTAILNTSQIDSNAIEFLNSLEMHLKLKQLFVSQNTSNYQWKSGKNTLINSNYKVMKWVTRESYLKDRYKVQRHYFCLHMLGYIYL